VHHFVDAFIQSVLNELRRRHSWIHEESESCVKFSSSEPNVCVCVCVCVNGPYTWRVGPPRMHHREVDDRVGFGPVFCEHHLLSL